MRRAVIGLALVLAAAALSPGAGAATAPSPAPVRVVHGPKPPPPHPPPTDGCITDQSLVRQCDKLWRQCYVRNQQQPAACTGRWQRCCKRHPAFVPGPPLNVLQN